MQTTNDLLPVRIKEMRKKAGLTQNQLGEKLGVSGKTISAWEKGTRKPTWEVIDDLVAALNTTWSYLLGNKDDPTPDPTVIVTQDDLDRMGFETELEELEERLPRVCRVYGELDSYGQSAVNALLNSEYVRCRTQRTLHNYGGYSVHVKIKPSSKNKDNEE